MNFEQRLARDETSEPIDVEDVDVAARRRRRRNIIIVVVAVIAVIAVAYALMGGGAGEDAGAAGDEGQTLPRISVVIPGSDSVTSLVSSTGTLAARREMPIGIPGEGGQVVRVLVDAGDWAEAGQVLAVIDRSVQSPQIEQARANIAVARADVQLAQNELDRALALVSRGFISRADVDRRTATRDAAVARVNVAQAQLAELNARSNQLSIRAPAAGLILERMVEPGQVVGAGSGVLFRMARGGEMELNAQVSETDLRRLAVGQTARVTPVGSSESFEGEIWQLAPVISAESRQGTASIALSYNPALRPGGFAQAEIVSGAVDAPLLPESAIQNDAEGSYVYIVDGDNKVVRRPIQVGNVTSEGVVIAGGLRGNERVVVSAGAFVNPGDEVVPTRVAPNSVGQGRS